MPGMYVVENGGVAISTAITIIQLKAGANRGLEVVRAKISQAASETSTMEHIQLLKKTAAATVTSRTPLLMNYGGAAADAAGGAAATGITATVEGTDGDVLVEEGFNILNGWEWLPTPEERIILEVGDFIALKFGTAPASQTWYASIYFREF